MKKNILKKIVDIKDISTKEKILLVSTLLVLSIVILSVIKNVEEGNKAKINYKKFNIENAVTQSTQINDRQIYWDLYNIISKYIYSYSLNLNTSNSIDYDKIDYSIEDYYNVLSEEYKSYINKSDYIDISTNFCKKFVENENGGENIYFPYELISEIYKLSDKNYGSSKYLCKLNTINNDTTTYIGVSLYQSNNTYNIFYLK